jgi:hypothetical protein
MCHHMQKQALCSADSMDWRSAMDRAGSCSRYAVRATDMQFVLPICSSQPDCAVSIMFFLAGPRAYSYILTCVYTRPRGNSTANRFTAT